MRLIGYHAVVAREVVRTRNILIATGSEATPFPGLEVRGEEEEEEEEEEERRRRRRKKRRRRRRRRGGGGEEEEERRRRII